MSQLGPEAQYQQFLAAGRFMIQRFRASGRFVFYPRLAQPASGESEFEWEEASGRGTVYSVTVVYPRPPEEPYPVALIDLAEGVRMMSCVEGIAPQEVCIGMAVRARIEIREGRHAVVFRPA